MNKHDFHSPQAGQAIFTPRGYWAFIPAPLPPEISYDPSLVRALSRADAALSELSGLGRHIINPHLLIASYVWPCPEKVDTINVLKVARILLG